MPETTIRIATRESALALWQANHVAALINQRFPDVVTEIHGMTTQGDRNKVSPLGEIGGKGVFVKELETALLDGSVDIAVHSMKDVPAELPEGLAITGICERANPHDAFVSNSYRTIADLPAGSVVGSSSARRCLQLARRYPHLTFKDLRGNVDTRLKKLDAGDYDAIILAVAGLERLGLAERVAEAISADDCLPAAGQGAVGIEARQDDVQTNNIIAAITHEETFRCVMSERAVTAALGATCTLPIAVFARRENDNLEIRAFVSDLDGNETISEQTSGAYADAASLASNLGERLVAAGALDLINAH